MVPQWLALLESSALAQSLRDSVWAYPLINAGHICGVALLVGAIVPLDLRLLGAWRSVPMAPLWQVLRTSAAVGLVLAAACGAALFIVRATEYAQSGYFLGKMAVIGLGVVNALGLRRAAAAHLDAAALPPRIRIAAAISLGAWLGALILGRLIGYF